MREKLQFSESATDYCAAYIKPAIYIAAAK
jgi:hypothetical protein